jgi:hypothetical protein
MKVNAWKKKMEKQIILGSVWESLSNRVDPTRPVANGSTMTQVPDSVVNYVSSSFQAGVQFVVCPSMSKLYKKGQGGSQPVQGNEEVPELQFKQVHYNVQRKGVHIKDGSVDGDLTTYYPIMEAKNELIKDYFTELSDYNYNRAVIEGADEFLTEAEYWTGDSISTPPVLRSLHPVIIFRGASAPVTYNSNQTTYYDAVATALNAQFTDGTTVFDIRSLDAMVHFATKRVQRLSWKNGKGNSAVNYVILLTETQAEQLATQVTDPTDLGASWNQLMREADVRGDGKNKAITGILGVYKNALVISNPRQSIFNCEDLGQSNEPVDPDGNGDTTFRNQYVKPWEDTPGSQNFLFRGDNRVPIEKGGVTGSRGTCETAICLGRGAMGAAIVKSLDFNMDDKDYKFSTGYEARRSTGCERMDWVPVTDQGATPINWSSYLYFTPTPATVF